MKNKRTLLLVLFSFVVCLVAVLLGAWLKSTAGMAGLLSWDPHYRGIYNGILYSMWLPVILAILASAVNEKSPRTSTVCKVLCIAYSAVCMVGMLGVYAFFSVKGSVRIKDLAPLTVLQKDTSNQNGMTLPDRTKTASDTDVLLHLAFASDPHWGSDDASAADRSSILTNIAGRNYDALFLLGDISDFGSNADFYKEAADELSEKLKKLPVCYVMGNHDALINNDRAFSKAFMNGSHRFYYRIDCGAVHIIVLNLLWDAQELTAKQKDFLTKELSTIPNTDTVFVLSHCALASSGYYTKEGKLFGDNMVLLNRLGPAFEKYKVDLVISGHTHLMEYLERHEISYSVIGAMGGKLAPVEYVSPWSKWLDNTHFGWLEVDVYRTFFIMSYYNSDGTLLMQAMRDTVIEESTSEE